MYSHSPNGFLETCIVALMRSLLICIACLGLCKEIRLLLSGLHKTIHRQILLNHRTFERFYGKFCASNRFMLRGVVREFNSAKRLYSPISTVPSTATTLHFRIHIAIRNILIYVPHLPFHFWHIVPNYPVSAVDCFMRTEWSSLFKTFLNISL